jgi:hypothetical protein
MASKLTIHATEALAQAEADGVNTACGPYYPMGTNLYTNILAHPDNGTWAVKYDQGTSLWYNKVREYLTDNSLLGNLVDFTEDWIADEF